MHTFIRGSLFLVMTAMIAGCSSNMGTKSDPPAVAPTAQTAAADTCVMQSGGSNVLRLTLPADAKCDAKDGSLKIKAPQFELEVWLADGPQTVDAAVGGVSKQIVSEFKDFKPDQTTDLTVAGSPAKRLTGKGHEADDGDDGDADVIVFKVGDHVFVACTHDEKLEPPARAGLLATVQTAVAQ